MAEVKAENRTSVGSKESVKVEGEGRASGETPPVPQPPPPPMGKIAVDTFGFYKQITTAEMKKRLEPEEEVRSVGFVAPEDQQPPPEGEETQGGEQPQLQPEVQPQEPVNQKLSNEEVTPDQPQYFAQDLVRRYTLSNPNGMAVQVITYGATITTIKAPDKDNVEEDIILGFDNLEGYLADDNQGFGSTVGRYTGLIKSATVNIGEDEFFLTNNSGEDHVDGGYVGLDKVLWHGYVKKDRVIMTYSSPDEDEGYPGNLMVQMSFHLTMNNSLIINTTAVCSKPTPVNITQRIFFNLAGHGAGLEGTKQHCLLLNADKFIEKGEDNYPTGNLIGVGGTYYDLRVPRPLKNVFSHVPNGGYDNTFCLTKGVTKNAVTFAARLVHPDSGRFLEIQTDQPAIHLYTADRLPNCEMPPPNLTEKKKSLTVRELDKDSPDDGTLPKRMMSKHSWEKQRTSKDKEEHTFPGREPSEDDLEAPTVLDKAPRAEGEGGEGEEDTPIKKVSFEEEVTPIDGDIAASDEEEERVPEWEPPKPIIGKSEKEYKYHGAICLIPQDFTGALTNRHFPKTILYPGQTYNRTTVYRFGVVPQSKEPRKSLLVPEEGEITSTDVLETLKQERKKSSGAGRKQSEPSPRKSSAEKK